MKLFDKFKQYIAVIILMAFIPSQAWGQGINIPANDTLNIGDSSVTVSGGITNAGTITSTTGPINLTGNWANSGNFNSGTSTVTFNGTSGTQTLDSGGTLSTDAFYNLTHNSASTVQMSTHPILIDNNFTNTSSGIFNANTLNMTVDGNWDNGATGTFLPGASEIVTLNGTNQSVLGSTNFSEFSKIVSSGGPYTLTFDTGGVQTFNDSLTMQGNSSENLLIRSNNSGTKATIHLAPAAPQYITDVDVKDSDAGTSPTNQTLVGRGNSVGTGNYNNWNFGNTTITWTGVVSTEWNNPQNWTPLLVPAAGDTVIIPPTGGTITYDPNLCPSTHTYACGAVVVGNLTLQANSTLTLSGENLTVGTNGGGPFSNLGNIFLEGNETLTLTQDTTHGTYTFVGQGGSSSVTHTFQFCTNVCTNNVVFNNLVIDDTNATPADRDVFSTATNSSLTINSSLTVTSGTLNADASGSTIADSGSVSVATNGIFDAPSSTGATAFTVAGSWTNNGGTFNAENGLVTFNGTGQSISGSTTFYQFSKIVASADTLTFDHTGTQTFTNALTMEGASGQDLSIRSSLTNNQADIILASGALQVLNYLNVQDSNAGTPPADVTLVPNNSTDNGDNHNWIFNGATITWKGGTTGAPTAWNTASNWDLGFVPRTQDTVIIANAANQPVLSTPVTVTNLTINSGSSLTLSGQNLTVSSGFSNSGNVILEGNETLTLTMDSTHGTFTYIGEGGGASANVTLLINGSNNVSYNNLVIDDTNTHQDAFLLASNATLTINSGITVTASTIDTSASGTTVTDNGSVSIASGATLIAPTTVSNTAFTVSGNWSNSGTFTNSSGQVTLTGTNQHISGTSTFANLRKVVTSADTLTLDHSGIQTVTKSLILTGAANPNRLSLVSDSPTHAAELLLLAGGAQTISDLSVTDSNAGALPTDVTLIDRNDYVNGGNDTNWQFGGGTFTWTGTTSTDWNTASNWNLGTVPTSTDSVTIANAANQPVLSTSVTVANLTINSSSTLTLNGQNLTVGASGAGTFINHGNVFVEGDETMTLTQDTAEGTFTYVGQGTGTSIPHTLSICTTSCSDNVSYYNLVIDDTHGTPDSFILSGSLTISGNLSVTAALLDASSATDTIAVTGSVSIGASGTLKAPAATTPTTFTIGANWTNSGGTFNDDSGEVTFNTAATTIIAGTNTFYDFTSTTPGKTIEFTATEEQTVTKTFDVAGSNTSHISLLSTVTNTPWKLDESNPTAQIVGELTVQDSNAHDSANPISCLNCTPDGDNTNWIFSTLLISVPANGTTVGQAPTVIGQGATDSVVYIRDISGDLVATAKTDDNGNFRVVVGQDQGATSLTITQQLALGANSLTPYPNVTLTSPGVVNNVTVVANPTAVQIPTVTGICPQGNPTCSNITASTGPYNISGGPEPVLTGVGAANQPVIVEALTYDGSNNFVLTNVGSGTTSASGAYSITLTTALPSATNYLSVTVGSSSTETASIVYSVSLTDPFGVVFSPSNNQPIQSAVITLYDATTKQPAAGTLKSCNAAGTCCDMSGNCCTAGSCTAGNPPGNPFTTLADGFYSFLVTPGNYYLGVSAAGYTFPSTASSFPAGRTVGTGSKGQTFTVGSSVAEIDLPVDGNSTLLHITKTANKSEASVGDIITYTVNIQNLSSTNTVDTVQLDDEIPPGFKYLNNRVILNGAPISNPMGQRPLIFSVGNVLPSTTEALEYQLVIGSGVTMGTYKNTALAQFPGGQAVSNPAQASVKIIPDPVFDLGSVIGKVFFDWNENGIQDPPYYDPVSHETVVEKPVPNVQIVMEDGTIITTDRDGKFNIPGLLPGRHLFRLDERTLPPGAYLTTDKAVLVDVTAGSISKVNFGINIDESQTKSKDAVFFNEKIRLVQDTNRPVPRLNAALFNVSPNAAQNTEEVLFHGGSLVRQAEFRIFTNYAPFISSWRLDIMDADTKKIVKSFEGTPININDPIYWNGFDDQDVIINPDFKYSYVLSVTDKHGNTDDTKEKSITVRQIVDDAAYKKETEEDKDILKDRAERYRKWIDAQQGVNNVNHQLIPVQGATIHLNRQGTDVRSIHIMKSNEVFYDMPLSKQNGLTPDELLASGFSSADEQDNLEVILPNGDYSIDVVSAKASDQSAANTSTSSGVEGVSEAGGSPSPGVSSTKTAGNLEHYSRPLKVGDDYMMFVALGDAQAGYNIDTGNIEPIEDKTELPGFYKDGKGAFYLKGQILGKYLITSSYDSDRAQKALFRQLDPNVYYPVYGDNSTINYDATDTQGNLYLLVQWDKSSAIIGNYAVDFNDTEFSAFSRDYYGGKIDYQSVSSTPYGDARTKLVIYHAQVQQLPSHNEFLATGGSLYFLKYRNVVQGSDTVTLQVRDATTGLVVASQTMVNGADYELDNGQGRILFWQPVSMIAQSESIISNNLVNGDPIYVVVDYQYQVPSMAAQASQGARVAQAVTDNLVLGGTYVDDNSTGQEYKLEGTDATLHVNKDTTIKAEYAHTQSQETGSYVSTDGGITFTSLQTSATASGSAYGITGDARLFDNIGFKSYYKWVDANFGATDTTSQQGKQTEGISFTWDMTPVTRLTASEDIQKLMANANLEATTQVGASETDTTMVQIVHQAKRLTLTGQFQVIETKSVVNGVLSTTNQHGATFAGQAQYDITDRIKATIGQQVDVQNSNNSATTIGITDRVTDHTAASLLETISPEGTATTFGVTNQLNKRIDLTTNYTLTNLNTGEVDNTTSVALEDRVNNNLTTTASVAQTGSSIGTTTTSASLGTKDKLSNNTSIDFSVGKSQSSTGAQSTSVNLNGTAQVDQNTTITATTQASSGSTITDALGIGTTGVTTTSVGLQATQKVDSNTQQTASLTESNDTTGVKTTTIGFGDTSKLDQELQAVTDNSFSFSPQNGTTDQSKYGLVRSVNGQNLEGDITNQVTNQPGNVSNSNIFGLSGDVNDRLALNGSIQKGKVQNLDGTQSNRTDFSVGAGYVLKDTVTAEERLKNSLKLEYRVDQGIGTDSLHQYVLYDAFDGKVDDNFSVTAKIDYSKTEDITAGTTAERHKEIILGMAYRPINFDDLNFITEYSYQDGYGGGLQQADAMNTTGNQVIAQVLSAEGVYDINAQWQAAEKIAYRIESEQDTGFDFTQTHTWLVIHRLNYKISKDWTISGEYRDLVQVEAKDNKQGILLQATRAINQNTEMTIGWNFTDYTDDLTNLSYTAMGPFVRMDGKFYDRTPEEKARDRAKWLDAKIDQWAWILIRKELSKKDSKIVLELNRLLALAKLAQKQGNYEESKQIYKDIITAGQIMYDEAYEYIRNRIDVEEKLVDLEKTARQYFKGGEYVKARKIWEKVVEDASSGMVK